ncbi:hypothetical protein P4604_08520 [Lysinibacillus capsici]|uniref:hypothetical protein n=1 Tax=Lysinibacillus capsici TaxID=2115968 RepID=UPI002E2043C2|nr:hypothetical protein [Lysinibacillus capsici]
MKVNIEKLAAFIEYVYEGLTVYPFQAYIDDKGSKDSSSGTSYWDSLNKLNVYEGLPAFVNRCELEKRALCFYMNGSMYKQGIKKIRFHFVDIDSDGGSKEEQLERIMNAPLKPTVVYEGRAGYKVLYEVIDAYWDNTTEQALNDSTYVFEKIQFQLIGYFQADRRRRKPNDCFRLPYVNNYKEWSSNGKVYQEKILDWDRKNVYTQQQLADAFPPGEEPKKSKKMKMYDVSSKDVVEVIDAFTDNLDMAGLDYWNYGNKISYQCPVHGDSKPSAYIFFERLICHCSNGENGECEIGQGKPLSWLAEHQGWEDLYELAYKLEAKPAEKYEKITLEQLQEHTLTPLLPKETQWDPVVKNVVAEITATMQRRKIIVDESSQLIYLNLVNAMNNIATNLSVWPLEPGGGKSTTFVSYLKYMLEHHIEQAGTIVVVERNETALALAKELGQYPVCFEATEHTAFDADYCLYPAAAYVMQSAYTYKKCKKNLTSYEHNVCGRCSFKKSCVLPKKHDIQKNFPIVIMTHARFQMEGAQLKNYAKWIAKDGKEYGRKRLVIDEKPPIINIIKISTIDLETLIYDLKNMELEIGRENMISAIKVINELKMVMLSSERGVQLPPLDASFKFIFEAEWYKHYNGSNVSLLKHVEAAITQESVVNEYNKKITITTAQKVIYDLSSYNTVILDGTAKYDLEYQYLNNIQMMDVPTLKSYDHLTLNYDITIPSSKKRLLEDKDLVIKLAQYASEKSLEEPVLLLCYKFMKGSLESLLANEIKAKRIAINHFGNIKGSNSYSQYSCLIVVGIINKGDAYYLSKSGAIFSEEKDLELTTIKKNRRFNSVDIKKYKLSDQVVGSIQDILRTSIRSNGNSKKANVYIFSRDIVLLKLLYAYFNGSKVVQWNLLDSNPDWFEGVCELFSSVEVGSKIAKATIRKVLNLEGEAGKKQLQRIMQSDEFTNLLSQYNVVKHNTRAFVKLEVVEQASS